MCQAFTSDSYPPSFLFHPPYPASSASPSSPLYRFVLSVSKSSLFFRAKSTLAMSLSGPQFP